MEDRPLTSTERSDRFHERVKQYSTQMFEEKDREVLEKVLTSESILRALGQLYKAMQDQPLQFLGINWSHETAPFTAADLSGNIRGRMEFIDLLFTLSLPEIEDDE